MWDSSTYTQGCKYLNIDIVLLHTKFYCDFYYYILYATASTCYYMPQITTHNTMSHYITLLHDIIIT